MKMIAFTLLIAFGSTMMPAVSNAQDEKTLSELVARDWGAGTIVSERRRNAGSPSVLLNKNGDAVAVWIEEGIGNFKTNIYSSQLKSGAHIWTPSIAIGEGIVDIQNISSPSVQANYSYDFAVDDNGSFAVTWSENNRVYLAKTDLNGAWSKPSLITDTANQVGQPRLELVNGKGIVGWYERSASRMDVKVAVVNIATSTISEERTLSTKSLLTSYDRYQDYSYIELQLLRNNDILAVWPDADSNLYYARYSSTEGWGTSSSIEKTNARVFKIVPSDDDAAKVIYIGADDFAQNSLLVR
ncbi:MAG: hypothetical protein EOP04_22970, partial [Proteobacteria bacterium]